MAFIINTTTVANNRPNVSYTILINKPNRLAQTSTRHANTNPTPATFTFTANTLVIG
jgi:hypothetical protein